MNGIKQIYKLWPVAIVALVIVLVSSFSVIAQDDPTPTSEPTPTMEASPTPDDIPTPTEVAPVDTKPPYESRDSLPDCDESYDYVEPKNQTPVDMDAPIVCKLRYLEPGDERNSIGVTAGPRYSEEGEGVKSAQSDAILDAQYSWAANKLVCGSNCGDIYSKPNLLSVSGVLSAKQATLLPGKSWSDYHFVNRIHMGTTTSTISNCSVGGVINWSGNPNVSIGLLQGAGVHATYTGNMRLFWEKFLSTSDCDQVATSTTFSQGATAYVFIGSYTDPVNSNWRWYAKVWINGTWASVFDVSTSNTSNRTNYIDAGQELAASAGDKTNMTIPLNYIHKLDLNYAGVLKPWEDEVLHANLNGKTSIDLTIAWPFILLDLVSGNYTSIATQAPL